MSYIKKQHELDAIREGGRRMGEILEMLAGMVKPGVSGYDLDAEAERLIRAAGGVPAFKGYRGRQSGPPFPSTICFSVNEELVHGIATKEKIIRDGDIVSIDIGMKWPTPGGYFTDTAVTVAVGKVPENVQELLHVTKEALDVGIRAAQPGATVAAIGRAVEEYVHRQAILPPVRRGGGAGQGKYGIVRDLVGHGVGHAVHEEPRVPNYYDKALENWVLAPGVVIAIEPMITLGDYRVQTGKDGWTITTVDGSLSAHFEHTIIITSDGPVVATRRPREIEIQNSNVKTQN